MKRAGIEEIIADIIAGEEIAPDDKIFFEQWYEESDENRIYFDRLRALRIPAGNRPVLNFPDVMKIASARKRRRKLRYISSAAVFALIAASSALLFLNRDNAGVEPDNVTAKVTLTLSNGERVVINENGLIADGKHIIKTGENSLVYDAVDDGQVLYNTLTVPCGSDYKLRLADGSFIYLNSGTELRYPVSFAGETREVYLSGEAYFEIESDTQKPFVVHAGGIDVKVTGTSFNVSAYPDRQTVTATLEKGAVQFADGTHTIDMKPGMHASYDKATAKTEIKNVDTRYYTSWKDGYIYFDDMRMEDIMQTLALWYDLDVEYMDQEAKEVRFGGRCTRYEEVTYLLGKFSETGEIDFKIEGRNISVSSKR